MKFLLIASILYFSFIEICDCYEYKIKYFKQKVDHFAYSNNDYFMQRYLLNCDYYSSDGNGTLFVYAGNEGDIEMFANNTGFMWENAAAFKACLIFIEHRYYGKTLPYGDLSYANITYLGYLTTEQALADYASLISFLKTSIPNAKKAPVIVFGGSYGGMLSAWFRIKYPHIANGAISSSAPILQFGSVTLCDTFSEIVTQDFTKESSECSTSIRKSWDIIRRLYKKTGGMEFLRNKFHICESSFNVSDLINWLSDTWSYMAMTNYPYPTSFLVPLPAYPIKVTCSYLQNSSVSDLDIISNIYAAASVFYNSTGKEECFSLTASGGKSLGQESWQFQACTEMVQPTCPNGLTDMFEPAPWNLTKYTEECFKQYGVIVNANKTLLMYGGQNISASSNIVFTNGLLDPWYGGGILKSLSDSLIAIVMKDAAHHLDLRSSNPADPPSVVKARLQILKYIRKWISEEKRY